MSITPKNYLSSEGHRNRINADVYTRLMKRAFGDNNAVIVGHHLTFEADGNLETENEIPAADTLIFDHDVMRAVFAGEAMQLMRSLAEAPVDGSVFSRDATLTWALKRIEAGLLVFE